MSRGFKEPLTVDNFAASGDLSASQNHFVTLDSSDQVALVSTAGSSVLGVQLNKPTAAGDNTQVGLAGLFEVELGGTVDAGELVMSNAAGEAIKATLGKHAAGMALEDGVDGDVVQCLIFAGGRKVGMGDPTFTVGTESGNVINVAIQFNDEQGAALDVATAGLLWYASDSAGLNHIADDANLSSAIGTDGSLEALSTDGPFHFTTEADGDLDIDITKTDAGTIYVAVQLPDGSIAVSGAVTFA